MPGVHRTVSVLLLLGASLAVALAMACSSDPEIITKEVVVEKEVVKTVEVPGETVVKEVVKTVEVPGQTVVKEVVKTVEVPGQTVVVEKEVVKTVEVPGQTVVVEKPTIVELVVTPTPVILAAPAAVQAPSPKGAPGVITIAISDVAPGVGLGSSQVDDGFHYRGVGEVTFQSIEGNNVAPMLATGYTLNTDLSGGTLSLRDDVKFHGEGLEWAGNKSWGKFTAQDLAFTLNDGNGAINTGSIHWQAGDIAALFGTNPIEVIDDNTVKFTFPTLGSGSPQFDPRWNANLLNDAGQAFSVQSATLRDERGLDFMKDNPLISTGPLHIIEWVQDDIGIVEPVPYDHWAMNSAVDRIVFREVVEESTKIALMETGEVDAASITLKNLPRMLEGGFAAADNGLAFMEAVVFSGNLWETHHVVTGEELDYRGVYTNDVPWVGDPLDADDMEEARLVRNALSRAIDRELINETLLGGLGFAIHLNQFSSRNPNWQAKWEYPYDPAEAERLLEQAAQIGGRGSPKFDIPLYGPDFLDAVQQEVADAVAGFWEEIGIKTSVQKYAYSVYRPTIVARATTMPWVTPCDDGRSTWPWDWPKSQDHTTLTRGGFGCGIEDPFVAQKWLETALEPDLAKRIALTNQVADHLFHQATSFGVVAVPSPIIYNPNKIAEWPMDPALFSSVNKHEAIVPAGR